MPTKRMRGREHRRAASRRMRGRGREPRRWALIGRRTSPPVPSTAAEKGPDARRRPKSAGEAWSLHVEPAGEGGNEADGPLSAAVAATAREEVHPGRGHHHLAMLVSHLHERADDAAVGLAPRRRRLEDGQPRAEGVTGTDGLHPAQLVDAGRAHAGGVLEEAVVEEAHQGAARVPAAGDEPAPDAGLGRLLVGVEGLRVELASEAQHALPVHGVGAELDDFPRLHVIPVAHDRSIPSSSVPHGRPPGHRILHAPSGAADRMRPARSAPSTRDASHGRHVMDTVFGLNWGVIALRGALAVAFGLYALLAPGLALATLIMVFGAMVLVAGILS